MNNQPLSAKLPHHRVIAVTLSGIAILLSGCSAGTNGTATSSITPVKATTTSQGRIMGGQQPVTGATIQLYTVSTAKNGGNSTALIASTIISSDGTGVGGNASNADNTLPAGEFSITGDYSCSSATQVYITATGGNAGGGSNSDIGLMAAVGSCTALQSDNFITVNELTTVAAVYALAPFMKDALDVGAVGSNPTGLVNAFNMASTLVNFQTGVVATPSSGLSIPSSEINTLADILAACVNSTNNTASTFCTSLLSATGAAETIGAGLAIAKNPGSATIVSLYSLVTSTPPFVPTLSSQPSDFTLAVNYTGSALASPAGIAIDASGNAWVSNEGGFSVVKMPSLSSSFATSTYSNGNLVSPRGISIDRTGNIWIANTGGNSVVELNSSGTALSGTTGFTSGSISTPVAVANDSAGNVWIANFGGNSITELNASGVASGASPITASSALSGPTAIALDSTGRVAVANAGTGQLCLFSNAALLQSCIEDGDLFGSSGVAISSTGNIAMTGSITGVTVTGAFTLASNTGAVNASSPVLGGGLILPTAVAFDGNGTAWITDNTSLSAFSGTTAITPSAGFGSLNAPVALAIDSSGNIWTANSGNSSVSIFVGLATPVVTPIAANVGP